MVYTEKKASGTVKDLSVRENTLPSGQSFQSPTSSQQPQAIGDAQLGKFTILSGVKKVGQGKKKWMFHNRDRSGREVGESGNRDVGSNAAILVLVFGHVAQHLPTCLELDFL